MMAGEGEKKTEERGEREKGHTSAMYSMYFGPCCSRVDTTVQFADGECFDIN